MTLTTPLILVIFSALFLSACNGDTSVDKPVSPESTSSNISIDSAASTMSRQLPPHLQAIQSSPEFKSRLAESFALIERLAQRPKISFAFVDSPLPNGVVAIVRLNQPDAIGRYAVVSVSAFDNSVRVRANGAVRWFEGQRENDKSPTTITVFDDGRAEATSQQLGATVLYARQSLGASASSVASQLLKQLKKAPVLDVPGFGPARIVRQ